MTPPKIKPPIPVVALELPEAAAALSMAPTTFDRYVKHEVKLIRHGGVRVPVAELERWAIENADYTLPGREDS